MNIFTLKLSGTITIGNNDTQLQHDVEAALEKGHDVIILEMRDLKYMDSSGIGCLAAARELVVDQGAQLALIGMTAKLRRLLGIMSFLELFQVYDSIEDAIQILHNREHARSAA